MIHYLLVAPLIYTCLNQVDSAEVVLEDKFEAIVRKKEYSENDRFFLCQHQERLLLWAEAKAGVLLARPNVPSQDHIRLQNLLIAIETAKVKPRQQGKSITWAFLRSDDFRLQVKRGVVSAALSHPELLVEALKEDCLTDSGVIEVAVYRIAAQKIRHALPWLNKITMEYADTDVGIAAEIAMAVLEERTPEGRYDKSTPVKMARNFVSLVWENPSWFIPEEAEFWFNPLNSKIQKEWGNFVAEDSKETEDGKEELSRRNNIAKTLDEALKNPRETFSRESNIYGESCEIQVGGQPPVKLQKDIDGQWRFQY